MINAVSSGTYQRYQEYAEKLARIEEKIEDGCDNDVQLSALKDAKEETLSEMRRLEASAGKRAEFVANGGDGYDDGNIGFAKATGNFCKGIGNFFKNMVCDENGFSWGRTLTTVGVGAAMAGLCFIPGGQAVAALLAKGFAVYAAGKTAIGTCKALSASTDAEAEQAWQEVGSDATGTALAIIGAKGTKNIANTVKNSGARTAGQVKADLRLQYGKGGVADDVALAAKEAAKAAKAAKANKPTVATETSSTTAATTPKPAISPKVKTLSAAQKSLRSAETNLRNAQNEYAPIEASRNIENLQLQARAAAEECDTAAQEVARLKDALSIADKADKSTIKANLKQAKSELKMKRAEYKAADKAVAQAEQSMKGLPEGLTDEQIATLESNLDNARNNYNQAWQEFCTACDDAAPECEMLGIERFGANLVKAKDWTVEALSDIDVNTFGSALKLAGKPVSYLGDKYPQWMLRGTIGTIGMPSVSFGANVLPAIADKIDYSTLNKEQKKKLGELLLKAKMQGYDLSNNDVMQAIETVKTAQKNDD